MLLYITIFLSNRCNYNCIYCKNKNTFFNKIEINTNKCIQFINDYCKNNNYTKINIEFNGDNEPTLYYNKILQIIAGIKCEITKITIFSNLSQNINIYNNLLLYKNIFIIATWHSLPNDVLNKKFIEKINTFSNYKNITAHVMLENNFLDESMFVFNKINIKKELILIYNTKYPNTYIYNNWNLLKNKYAIDDFVKTNNTLYIDEIYHFNKLFSNKRDILNTITIRYDGKIFLSDLDAYSNNNTINLIQQYE